MMLINKALICEDHLLLRLKIQLQENTHMSQVFYVKLSHMALIKDNS